MVRSRAHELFLEPGPVAGHDLDDWLQAEREIEGRSEKMNIGALSLNVMQRDAGEPVLLFLHYWGGSARTWDGELLRLSTSHTLPASRYKAGYNLNFRNIHTALFVYYPSPFAHVF